VDGINREVAPFLRMTDPTHGAHFDAEPWRTALYLPIGTLAWRWVGHTCALLRCRRR
jgi:hypothetical protein